MNRAGPALLRLLQALDFAAMKHRDQRRKGAEASPYINHPIQVARLLAEVGDVDDAVTLQAAILHDTIEDTRTTAAELTAVFGAEVSRLVEEVTDDKRLPKRERMRLQVEHADRLSPPARAIKIADKIANVRDVVSAPPSGWSTEQRAGYVEWSAHVVEGCRGINAALEECWDAALTHARRALAGPMSSHR